MPLDWEQFFVKPPEKIDPKILLNMENAFEDVIGMIGRALKNITKGILESDLKMKPKGPWHRKIAGVLFPLDKDIRMGANPVRVGVIECMEEFPRIMKAMKQKVKFAHQMVFFNATGIYGSSPAVWRMEKVLDNLKENLDKFITLVLGARHSNKESVFYSFEHMIEDLASEINRVFGVECEELLLDRSGLRDVSIRDKRGFTLYGIEDLASRVGRSLAIVTESVLKGDFSGPKPVISGLEKAEKSLDKVLDYAAREFRNTEVVGMTEDFIKKTHYNLNNFYSILLSGGISEKKAALATYMKIVEIIGKDFDSIFSTKLREVVMKDSGIEEAA